MVEIQIVDEDDNVIMRLDWKRRSKRACYEFLDSRIAKASFKKLGRDLGVDEETWKAMGI